MAARVSDGSLAGHLARKQYQTFQELKERLAMAGGQDDIVSYSGRVQEGVNTGWSLPPLGGGMDRRAVCRTSEQ